MPDTDQPVARTFIVLLENGGAMAGIRQHPKPREAGRLSVLDEGVEELLPDLLRSHRFRHPEPREHEDLPTLRFRGDARRQDHRRAEEIAVFLRWVRRR